MPGLLSLPKTIYSSANRGAARCSVSKAGDRNPAGNAKPGMPAMRILPLIRAATCAWWSVVGLHKRYGSRPAVGRSGNSSVRAGKSSG